MVSQAIVVASFSGLAAIFAVLTILERTIRRVAWRPDDQTIADSDVRFVYQVLQWLVPRLPPLHGTLTVIGTVGLVLQGMDRAWDAGAVLAISFAWVFTIGTFLGARLGPAVKAVLHGDPEGPIDEVRRVIGKLVLGHHLGLMTEIGVLVIQAVLLVQSL